MTGKDLVKITAHSTVTMNGGHVVIGITQAVDKPTGYYHGAMIIPGSPHSMNPPASTDEDPVVFVEVLIPVVERLSNGARTIVWVHQMVSLEELEDLRDRFRLMVRLYWLIHGIGSPINWIGPAH